MKKISHVFEFKYPRVTGCLFLTAFLAYGFGRYYFESELLFNKISGALLVISNSVIVVFIGVLLRKTWQNHSAWVGDIYLITRIFEAITLLGLLMTLIPEINFTEDYSYFIAMLGLGLGSIPMCWALYKYRVSPPWLALWGVIGYAVFAFGFAMELLGKAVSMYFLIPGGLWEITFAFWLIIKEGKYRKPPG